MCACQANMIGAPPNCKPECVVSAECDLQRACVNQRCVDPCIGACGQYAGEFLIESFILLLFGVDYTISRQKPQ